jgi:hypothetical protein
MAAGMMLFASIATAQVTVLYAKPFHARRPAGVAVDSTGQAIPGAKVETCQPHWRECVASDTTDASGRFRLTGAHRQMTYYLRFTAYGFDPLEFELRLQLFARKEVVAKMKVAT